MKKQKANVARRVTGFSAPEPFFETYREAQRANDVQWFVNLRAKFRRRLVSAIREGRKLSDAGQKHWNHVTKKNLLREISHCSNEISAMRARLRWLSKSRN